MKRIFREPLALTFAAVGVVLLAVAIHFNVNPVDGGAVRGGLQHHPAIFLPLAVATIPAMFLGVFVFGILRTSGNYPYVYFAVSFVSQFLLYFVIGLAMAGLARWIKQRKKRPPNHTSDGARPPADKLPRIPM